MRTDRFVTGAAITAVALLLNLNTLATAQTSKPAPAADVKEKATDMSKYKKETIPVMPKVTPQHITVQHILIGFKGTLPGKDIERTQEEAKKLAYEILEMARKGADFDTLCAKWTDDSAPGIYSMANKGVPVNAKEHEFKREGMVRAFGDVGFVLSPGNIGIADYDKATSPFGYHIIKRIK